MILSAFERLLRFLAGFLTTAALPSAAPSSAVAGSAASAASFATRNSLRLSVLRAISVHPKSERPKGRVQYHNTRRKNRLAVHSRPPDFTAWSPSKAGADANPS